MGAMPARLIENLKSTPLISAAAETKIERDHASILKKFKRDTRVKTSHDQR
jgi:hypothetical protein